MTENNINTKKTISTWRWRIVKANHNIKSFAEELDIAPSIVCEYLSGKKTPSLGKFETIENKLRELGV